jgi:hypothetical protein
VDVVGDLIGLAVGVALGLSVELDVVGDLLELAVGVARGAAVGLAVGDSVVLYLASSFTVPPSIVDFLISGQVVFAHCSSALSRKIVVILPLAIAWSIADITVKFKFVVASWVSQLILQPSQIRHRTVTFVLVMLSILTDLIVCCSPKEALITCFMVPCIMTSMSFSVATSWRLILWSAVTFKPLSFKWARSSRQIVGEVVGAVVKVAVRVSLGEAVRIALGLLVRGNAMGDLLGLADGYTMKSATLLGFELGFNMIELVGG